MTTTLSAEQQIAALRSTTGFAAHAHRWLLVGAALSGITAAIFWHPVPLMIAAFLGIIGLAEQRTGPNIVAAIDAYDSRSPTQGEVSIAISCWDTTNRYHATLREPGHAEWTYEFIPAGWQPAARSYPAKIWRTGSNGQPVLAVADEGEGLMIPRYDPKRSEAVEIIEGNATRG